MEKLYDKVKAVNAKAFVFDLDGTLADSVQSIAYCVNHSLKKYNFQEFETNSYKEFAGDGVDTLIHRALSALNSDTMENYELVRKEYLDFFAKNKLYNVKPFNNLEKAISYLKNKGIKLAVCSNKPDREAKDVVETLFGENVFDVIYGARAGLPLKPDPTGVNIILEELNLNNSDILYVGDTNTDMKTGKNVGAFTIGVTWGFRPIKELLDNGADLILDDPIELTECVD